MQPADTPAPQARLKILQLQTAYQENAHHWSDLGEQIIAAFDPERYEVVTAFFHGKPDGAPPPTRASRAVYLDFPESWSAGPRLRLSRALRSFLRRERFDAIICHRYKPVSLVMAMAPALGVRACVGISHSIGEYDRWWRRFRFQHQVTPHWRFVGVSDAVRDYLVGLDCGFTLQNTVAIENAIDVDLAAAQLLARSEARARLGLPADALIIGAVGRLVPVKAHDVLIRAFAKLAAGHPGARLAIIGEGRARAGLERLIGELGLEGRVHLLGFVAGAKQFLKAFDVLTMPSLKEGLGLALLEGMIAGLPVVASDVPAMAPIVRRAGGTLATPGDVDSLATALERWLEVSPSERTAAGQAAFDYVTRAHSIERYRQHYRDLVEGMLNV